MLDSGFIDDIARGSRVWDAPSHAHEGESSVGVGSDQSIDDRTRLTSSIYLEDALCN